MGSQERQGGEQSGPISHFIQHIEVHGDPRRDRCRSGIGGRGLEVALGELVRWWRRFQPYALRGEQFLTVMLGDKHHAVRRGVLENFPKMPETARIPDITVDVLWEIVAQSPEHIKSVWITVGISQYTVGISFHPSQV